MEFTLNITNMDGSAFSENEGGGPEMETARILREIADRIEAGHLDAGIIHDVNGNKVGQYQTTD